MLVSFYCAHNQLIIMFIDINMLIVVSLIISLFIFIPSADRIVSENDFVIFEGHSEPARWIMHPQCNKIRNKIL